jgi:hypothetical protein
MLVKRTILILLSLLILTGTVNAYYANPGPAATHFVNPVGPEVQWIIADIGQQNTITLVAYNTTYGQPVKNTVIIFSVDDPSLGSMSPQTVMTDASGTATSNFIVNSTQPKSGTATVTAMIQSTEGPGNSGVSYATTLSWDQKIDHNNPNTAEFSYDTYGDVASVLPVSIVVTDRWGNLIDDRFEKAHTPALPLHNLTLHINGPSPPNDCGFTDFDLVHDHEFSLDPNGELALNITSATKPGWHYILMDPMGNMPEQMKLFNTVSRNIPFSIAQVYDPDGDPYPTVYADTTHKFVFYYTVYDKYGTPTTDQNIKVMITSLDRDEGVPQENTLISGANGQNWSSFGPKSFTNRYSINATTERNSTIWANKTVRFYSASPSNIDVSANPQSMPSFDANPNIYSNISAKVVDVMGNGVGGVEVSFAITGNTKDPADATVTTPSSFSKTSTVTTATATTDENGYATVKFYPGAFPKIHEAGYKEAATGTTTVTAIWDTNQRDVKLTWKNYPYLSAVVSVNPKQVQVGKTVNVSIKLNGDGWALYKYPIDVNLVLDRSGSMGWKIDGTTGTPTRLSIAQAAANNFIGSMDTVQDRAGLWSYSSEGDVTNPAGLQSPFGPVITAVNGLGPTSATSTREGVKDAIADMIAHPNGNSKAVRAVIVMTDGDWNNAGSPLAHGTGWPANNSDYSFSGSNLEPDNYRYYDGLGGTLTPYATSTCAVYSSTVCDAYTCGSSGSGTGLGCLAPYPYRSSTGKCKTSSSGTKVPTPFTVSGSPAAPSWCTASKFTCTQWGCDAYVTHVKSTDGEFTEQNLSIYAKNHDIRLYFIFFAGTPTERAVTDLTIAAEATGGFYQRATTAAELDDAYEKIAGDLKTEAGVDTTATMDFGTLIVNNQLPTDVTANPYFEYVGDPVIATDMPTTWPGSTMLDKYNKTPNGAISQHLIPGFDESGDPFTDIGPIIINQTNTWNTAPQKLHFNIGTVNVNETWEADFRLKVLREGNILIFGPSSSIDFNNGNAGASTMTMPNLSLSATMNQINYGLGQSNIDVIGLARTSTGEVKGTLPVAWTMTYNGLSTNTITEEVSYIRDSDPPVRFAILTGTAGDLTGHIQTATLNTEKLPPGGYTIQIHAYAVDATVTKYCGPYTYSTQGRSFIKLE